MSTASLSPCPACQRHVRVDAPSCPFCASDLAGAALPVIPDAGGARLTRAALFAFATTVAACSTSQTPAQTPPPPQQPAPTPAEPVAAPQGPGTVAAIYGAPAPPAPDAGAVADAGAASPQDAGNPTRPTRPGSGSLMMRYGAPPVPDAFV
ncbi:MAG: hypothetical protein R3A48_02395 [Polyangiales bacterium]